MSEIKVLAIDPGPVNSAFVIWDGTRVLRKGIVENRHIKEAMPNGFDISACAIEMIASYGMPVGEEVFETCVWIGRFMARWFDYAGIEYEPLRIKRKEVCIHLCGSNRANDSNIRKALIDRLGPPGVKSAPGVTYGVHKDEWAALAVAVTALDRIRCGMIPGVTA